MCAPGARSYEAQRVAQSGRKPSVTPYRVDLLGRVTACGPDGQWVPDAGYGYAEGMQGSHWTVVEVHDQ